MGRAGAYIWGAQPPPPPPVMLTLVHLYPPLTWAYPRSVQRLLGERHMPKTGASIPLVLNLIPTAYVVGFTLFECAAYPMVVKR